MTVMTATPGKVITSDGNAYYAWLTSLTVDQDLDFRNDFMLLYTPDPVDGIERQEGQVKNVTPPGMALVMAPGFALAALAAQVQGMAQDLRLTPFDPLFKNVTAAWLVCLYLFGVAAFQSSVNHFAQDRFFSMIFTLVTVLGSNLVHYISKEPAMAHGAVFSLSAIATLAIFKMQNAEFRAWYWVGVGGLIGLLLALRNSSIVLVPWWFALGLSAAGPAWTARLRCAMWSGFGALVAFSIQPILLSLMHGSRTLNGYSTYGFSSGLEGVLGGLFSARHGLFAYHPIWILVILSVLLATRQRDLRTYALGALAAFAAAVLVNGTWPFWWFGDSFGNRAYIDVLAPCALVSGLWIFRYLKPLTSTSKLVLVLGTVACLILANFALWLGYLLKRYPADGLHTYTEAWLWFLRS